MHRTVAEIESLLRSRGLFLTPQRRAIVRSLVEAGGHWTAAQLHERVSGDYPLASRATVYSTLALLRDLGVVAAVGVPGGEVRFDANPEPHQHFVCVRCGRLDDVPASWFPVLLPAGVEPGFAVQRLHVLAEGLCAACGEAQTG